MAVRRLREDFVLYRVQYRNAFAEPRTVLVWGHRMCDALEAAEEYARQEVPHFLTEVLGITEVSKPDTDTPDYASVIWEGGSAPTWGEEPNSGDITR